METSQCRQKAPVSLEPFQLRPTASAVVMSSK